ncbi:MAG: TIGR03905 family TSCPD domain-containing protein [Eubacteriaceae bacterium]|jgi:uncharacterized protein (TIGR03905 family)
MHYTFRPYGTCSTQIDFDIDPETTRVTDISFQNGCDGNLKALSALADGLTADTIIEKCGSITCGRKNTSCSAQLAKAISDALTES